MNNKRKGIACILGAAFCFALMNLFVRTAGELPFIQKSFFRNIVAAVVAFAILIREGRREGAMSNGEGEKVSTKLTKDKVGLLFVRAGFGTMGILCNFYAIDHMNISDATMLNKLSPFFAIILSYMFLKERANVVQLGSVVVAFLGSLFIIKPSFSPEVIPAVVGTLGGFGAGVAYTAVRALGARGIKSSFIVFFFSMFSSIAVLPGMIMGYMPMSGGQLLSLLLAGASATGGQFCITAAYRFAPAKEISVFDYSQVVFAAILGLIFLGQIPDGYSIIGYVIICTVAVVMWKYNQRKDRIKDGD